MFLKRIHFSSTYIQALLLNGQSIDASHSYEIHYFIHKFSIILKLDHLWKEQILVTNNHKHVTFVDHFSIFKLILSRFIYIPTIQNCEHFNPNN